GSIGVLLLFLILFRSPRQLLLLLLPMAAGVGSGFAVGALVFGRVHGLTIAFGASLVGVCVDYAVHVICHRSLSPQGPALATSERRLWAGIWLGGGTTLAGLLGLAWTSFPGLREIAWVAFVGVLVALALTRLLLPAWLPAQLEPAPLPRRLSAWLYTLLGVIGRRRRPLALLSLLALGLCAAGLPRLVWADSLSALSHLDPALLAEDEAVRARVGRMDGSRMVIALGADSAEALARNELAADALEAAVAAGELEAFRSLRVMLPSEASQRRRLEALRADRSLPARLDAAFERAGFVSGTFAPFFDSLAHAPEPLALPELLDSSLGAAARPFRVQLEDRVAILLFVRGVRASDALEARLGALEGVHYLDQQALFTRAYGGFRERTLQQIGLGLIFVLLLLLLRYRRLGPALAALLPAVLAALATLGLLGHLGLEANLMHLVALLLVLSIGVDYGVFVIEHRDAPEALGPTLFAMGVACLTTLLGFGLLALSEDPPLRSLGIAVTLGVLLAAWLAPLSLWIVGRGPAR
ncbi:MAG: MMPL family transporter, partial [Myxococcales bacterium]|nr:MMPL family transporter [Myxococcales bacterium]